MLAVVGTGDRALDHRIAAACRERSLLVNTVDDIPWCDWSAPAILRRGDLTLAIGTGGIAPALAVRLRDLIGEELVGPEYAPLLELFAEMRPGDRAQRPIVPRAARALVPAGRRAGASDLIRAGDLDGARAAVETEIARWEAQAA